MMRPYATLAPAIGGLAAIALHAPCPAHVSPAALHAWRAAAQGWPTAAAAYAGSALVMPPALPPGGSYTPLGEGIRLQGQPVFAWVFDAPGSLRDLASWLTTRQPALRDLWVGPGAIVLAGIAQGMHWAARLSDAGAGRTRGTISAMAVDVDATFEHRDSPSAVGQAGGATEPAGAPHGAPGHGGRLADTGWRLPGGQLHFEFRSRDEAASIVEQIWTHATPPSDLRKQLAGELLAAGWRPADIGAAGLGASWVEGTDTPPAAQAWSRGRMTLSVIIVPVDRGSGVTAVMRIGA